MNAEEMIAWLRCRIVESQRAQDGKSEFRRAEESGKVIAYSRCLNWLLAHMPKQAADVEVMRADLEAGE